MVQALILGISNRAMRVITEKSLNLPPGRIAFSGLDRSLSFVNGDPKANVQISMLRNSRLANITADSQSPEFAANVVNAILDQLKVYNHIGGMIKELETQIDFSKSQTDITITQLADLTTQRLKLQQESDELESYIKKGFSLPNYPTFAQDSTLNNLKTQYFLVDSEYKALASTSTRGARLEGKSNELKSLRHQLEAYSTKLVESLRAEYSIKSSEQDGLQQIAQKESAKLQDLKQKTSKLVETLGNPSEMLLLAEDNPVTADIIVILNHAVPPPRPYWPNLTIYLVLGIGLGGIVGFLVSMFSIYWDKKVVSPAQIETNFRIPCLAVLPKRSVFNVAALHPTKQLESLAVSDSNRYLTQLLTLRAYFLTSSPETQSKVFGWAPLANQCSSGLLADLVRVLSDAGKRILIADLGFKRPLIAEHLGIDIRHLLHEWVFSSRPLGEFINTDSTGKISILSAGLQSSELINNPSPRPLSSEWSGLMDQFDYIFIYSDTIDEQAMSLSLPKFQSVILTVDYSKTSMSRLTRKIALIRRLKWRLNGIILTNAPTRVLDSN
jgi:capsular polysaccharide biosynthesis protein